jgi:hypothetical protein
MRKPRSSYLANNASIKTVTAPKGRATFAAFFALLAIMLGVFSAVPLTNDTPKIQEANALSLFCSDKTFLGVGMSQVSWHTIGSVPSPDAPNRSWTAQEAFGNSLSTLFMDSAFTAYTGEGAPTNFALIGDIGTDRGKDFTQFSTALSKLEAERTGVNCIFNGFLMAPMASTGLVFANLVATGASFVASVAFDSNIICKEPGQGGACIDILQVIGGTDPNNINGGLIGSLTGGLYLPLLVIVVSISGFWVLQTGIMKRKFREALTGALWIFGAIIFGLTILFKPTLLAKAPMAVSNTVGTCVIGAFTGSNCFNSSSTLTPIDITKNTSDTVCKSSASGLSIDEEMAMSINGLSCIIWKAFVLEPYAQAEFGTSFEALDITTTRVKNAAEKGGIDPTTFCVNLASTKSWNEQTATLSLDSSSNKVCNLALYQLYLRTNATSGTDASTQTTSTPDTRWYNIILTVANDDGMWSSWTAGANSSRFLIAGVAAISAVVGSFLIIAVGFFALMYYLLSIIMIAFAPLFLLIGVHPGRGKKIFIGWGELVLSNILKYLASAIFLLVAISFYAAVLGTGTNPFTTLLFVLILSAALTLYRKEIVGLIGKVNAGGEQLSNNLMNKMSSVGQKTGKLAVATGGSALGAQLAAGRFSSTMADDVRKKGLEEGLSDSEINNRVAAARADFNANRRKVAKAASTDGFRRELKIGGGGLGGQIISQATRQYERTSMDNRRDLSTKASAARDFANNQESIAATAENARIEKVGNLDQATINLNSKTADISEQVQNEQTIRAMEENALVGLDPKFANFAEMQRILNQLEALKQERAVAVGQGDTALLATLDARKIELSAQGNDVFAKLTREERISGGRAYRNAMNEEIRQSGNAEVLGAHYSSEGRSDLNARLTEYGVIQKNYEDARTELVAATAHAGQAAENFDKARVYGEALTEEHRKLVPGEIVGTDRMEEIEVIARQKTETVTSIPKVMPEVPKVITPQGTLIPLPERVTNTAPVIESKKETPKVTSTPSAPTTKGVPTTPPVTNTADKEVAKDVIPPAEPTSTVTSSVNVPVAPAPETKSSKPVETNSNPASRPTVPVQPRTAAGPKIEVIPTQAPAEPKSEPVPNKVSEKKGESNKPLIPEAEATPTKRPFSGGLPIVKPNIPTQSVTDAEKVQPAKLFNTSIPEPTVSKDAVWEEGKE